VLPLLLDEVELLAKGYNPRQPRDARGRFANAGAFIAGPAPVSLINDTLGKSLTPGKVRFSAKMHEKLQSKHADDYPAVMKHMKACISQPDYIGEHPRHPGKIMLVKKVGGLMNGKPAIIIAIVGGKDAHGDYPGASAYGLKQSQLDGHLLNGTLRKTKSPQ
jgi:hypothetical protein